MVVRKDSKIGSKNEDATEEDPVIYDRSQVIKNWEKMYGKYSTCDVIEDPKVSWAQMVEEDVEKGGE